MIVYFNTVRRKRPVKEGGELVQLDWTGKKILKTLPLYPTDPDINEDPNPRGNSRGGKGMLIDDKELFVGTYHTILVFDHDLNLKRRITNNLFSNIHEMCFAGDHIWVSSTTIDCAVLVDRQGRTLSSWWAREEELLKDRFGLVPMEIDKEADNRLKYLHAQLETKESHTHLNAVTRYGERTYALLKKQGAVVQIEPETEVLLDHPTIRGAHSPVITDDGRHLLLCGSFKKTVFIYDTEQRNLAQTIDLTAFPEIAEVERKHPDQPFNRSIFVRGLEILDDDRILVGISPAAILEIDIKRNMLLDFFQYTTEVGDAIHGLVHKP